nr:outer membrane beta-barrel protein [Methylocystis rosea]
MTHSGPENPNVKDPLLVGWPDGVIGGVPAACGCNPNNAWRLFNNLTATWNVTENLSFTSDISYFRESGWYPVSVFGSSFDALNALPNGFGFNASLFPQHPRGANAYGIAQYATYKIDDSIKLGARVEFWRDAKNFFAAAYPGYFDSVNAEHGFPAPSVIVQPQGQGTSYLAITAGVTFSQKLTGLTYFSGLVLRPEFRWEAAVNDAAPFFGPNGPKRTQGLFSMDVIAPFAIQ